MVLFLVLFLVFVAVTAACWFQGLWASAINVFNILFSAIIATNFWEPAADLIDAQAGGARTHLVDVPVLWGIFALSYIVLRSFTQGFSKYNVKFITPVDLVGRSILALWCGWVFTCFTAFTLMTAPIGASPAGAWSTPESKSFLFLSPEQQWLSFAQSRSIGALSRGKFSSAPTHPEDAPLGVEAFDPDSVYTFKYRARRAAAEGAN